MSSKCSAGDGCLARCGRNVHGGERGCAESPIPKWKPPVRGHTDVPRHGVTFTPRCDSGLRYFRRRMVCSRRRVHLWAFAWAIVLPANATARTSGAKRRTAESPLTLAGAAALADESPYGRPSYAVQYILVVALRRSVYEWQIVELRHLRYFVA